MAPRVLNIVPIVHSAADLGSLAPAEAPDRAAVVAAFWQAVQQRLAPLFAAAAGLHLYQDGLPRCGREAEIVADLAAQGSVNHAILAAFLERGATLHGTESGPLLVEELALHRAAAAPDTVPDPDRLAELLVARDRFIAARIDQTLPPGATGLVFLGALHDLPPHLAPDITVAWPVTRVRRPPPAEPPS